MEKRKYTVTVAGKPYTLVSSDGPEYVRRSRRMWTGSCGKPRR